MSAAIPGDHAPRHPGESWAFGPLIPGLPLLIALFLSAFFFSVSSVVHSGLLLLSEAEVLHDLRAACRAVQTIKVEARRPQLEQLAAQRRAEIDADLPHRLVVAGV